MTTTSDTAGRIVMRTAWRDAQGMRAGAVLETAGRIFMWKAWRDAPSMRAGAVLEISAVDGSATAGRA